MQYLYTFIIPHYNNFSYLERLLSTIPYRDDIQKIVVDNSSSNY